MVLGCGTTGYKLRARTMFAKVVGIGRSRSSKQEAIEWAKRCPASPNEVIEIRQVQELEDFPADVQAAASKLPEMQQRAAI
jgi:hypothetical protein